MVGNEGRLPSELDQVTRVRAVTNTGYVIKREMDLRPREDGTPWQAGQMVGLDPDTKLWREGAEGDAVMALITEVVR